MKPEDITQADELDELERLLAAATRGRLFAQAPDDEGVAIIATDWPDDRTPTNGLFAFATMLPTDVDAQDMSQAVANAALICAAVNALPKLITAARLAHTPAGVPREATAEMIYAGEQAFNAWVQDMRTDEQAEHVWRAMYDAALDAAAQSEGVGDAELLRDLAHIADERHNNQGGDFIGRTCARAVVTLSRPAPAGQREGVIEALAATAAARHALRDGQRQLDMEGCEVGVSRQALDETLDAIDRTLAASTGAVGGGESPEQEVHRLAERIHDIAPKARLYVDIKIMPAHLAPKSGQSA